MFASLNPRALGLSVPPEELIDLAAGSGFGGVDLLVRDLVDSGRSVADLRARMSDRGLAPGAWPLPVDWRGDESRFRDDLARLPRFAEAAAALGLTRTGTWVLPETPGPPPAGSDAAAYRKAVLDRQTDRLAAIATVLGAFGIRLGLEVIGVESFRHRGGLPLTTRMADLNEVLGPIRQRSGNVGVLVDVFHLHAAGEDLGAVSRWIPDGVVWVHVADLPAGASEDRTAIRDDDRGLPGESGWVDVGGSLRDLNRAGYRGPVTVEPMASCRAWAGRSDSERVERAADALRRVWPRADFGARVRTVGSARGSDFDQYAATGCAAATDRDGAISSR